MGMGKSHRRTEKEASLALSGQQFSDQTALPASLLPLQSKQTLAANSVFVEVAFPNEFTNVKGYKLYFLFIFVPIFQY